jgi:glycosyltransferase A (GT-A) superfamily protein (DUF2064 family)
VDKILLYAPPTESARELMQSIVLEAEQQQQQQQHARPSWLQNRQPWTLQPVVQEEDEEDRSISSATKNAGQHDNNNPRAAGTSTCLTSILQHALAMARRRQEEQWHQYRRTFVDSAQHDDDHGSCRVVFLGMDCPELPLSELVALTTPSRPNLPTSTSALLCPAADGGYGLLAVPVNAPATIFDGVQWSHSLTAVSQLKALTDAGLTNVVLGPLMHDIDTPKDVDALRNRLLLQQQQPAHYETNRNGERQNVGQNRTHDITSCLMRPSALAATVVTNAAVSCRYTIQALQDLGKFDP